MPEETEAQEETDETEEPTEEALQIRKMNAFLSPEGIIMMAIALDRKSTRLNSSHT